MKSPTNSLLILYATQTGRSEKLAFEMDKMAKSRNLSTEVWNMFDFNGTRLPFIRNLVVIVSTHGIGEPPFQAEKLYNFLHSPKALKLPNLSYAVLALGDSNYAQFCQAGKDFDQILEKLGAKHLVVRTDCDLDYKMEALQWMEAVLGAINQQI